MRKLLCGVLAAAMVLGMTACSTSGNETTASQTQENTTQAAGGQETTAGSGELETLIMATNAEFPPYEYYEGTTIVGIDVDIAAALAEHLGMEIKIEDMAFDSIIPSVQTGKADIGLAGITASEERALQVAFTDSYTQSEQAVIVKEGSEIASNDDLAGKIIGVQLGTTGDMKASELEAEGSTVERYNKGVDAVQALLQDKIDAVMIDREPAKVFVSENEGLKTLDEAYAVEDYAIAVAKENTELLDKLNAALADMKESGELQAIIDKYIKAE